MTRSVGSSAPDGVNCASYVDRTIRTVLFDAKKANNQHHLVKHLHVSRAKLYVRQAYAKLYVREAYAKLYVRQANAKLEGRLHSVRSIPRARTVAVVEGRERCPIYLISERISEEEGYKYTLRFLL